MPDNPFSSKAFNDTLFRKYKSPVAFGNQYSGGQKENQPYILDLDSLEYLIFQNLPNEISVLPESGWAAIQTPGRNLENYHYTGGSDTISFVLTWYCQEENREDALSKAKWLVNLGRNDGYNAPPPMVLFSFGKMYTASKFILFSAPYKFANFNRTYGMLPAYIQQEVTLKRVSDINPGRALQNQIDY